MLFLFLFVLIPLMEIAVFVLVSGKIGLGTALLMSLLTAIFGGALVRAQGMRVFLSAHETMQRGELPSDAMFDALCLAAAGALLITPGFISDVLGFLLLIPAVRKALHARLLASGRFESVYFNADFTEFHDIKSYHRPQDPDIIEAEYEVTKPTDKS